MVNLNLLNEVFTNNFNYEILFVLYICTVLCGILVISSKNPIVSVLFLIGLFLSVASYLMMAGMNFIGLSYLLVYVGAVSILFLFILMLINVRISELTTDNNNSIPSAIFITILISLVLYELLPHNYKVDTVINITTQKYGNIFVYNPTLPTQDILNKIIFNNNAIFNDDKLLLVSSHI